MRNSTLTFLELTPKQKIEDRLLFQIAEALEENSSLYHFALDGEFGPSTQPAQDAFERMLEVNFSLESFRLFTCEVQNTPEFQMYLRLNRVGRKLLLNPKGSPTRRDWTDVMGRVSDNLDCLFYLLSVNPFICHVTEELRYQNHQILISRRGNKRRRLNDDTVKQRSETNSSSVNSSLSSSEISSSPAQSAEDCEESSSTDSFEKKGRKKRSACKQDCIVFFRQKTLVRSQDFSPFSLMLPQLLMPIEFQIRKALMPKKTRIRARQIRIQFLSKQPV